MNRETGKAIIAALREGLGVEDIAAKGIATLDEARFAVIRFRRLGLMPEVLGKKEDSPTKCFENEGGTCINEAGRNGAGNTETALTESANNGGSRHG